jgi:phosphoglycerol geranylgeranyltransferase
LKVHNHLQEIKETGEKGLIVLLDPDKFGPEKLKKSAYKAEESGAKAVLIGGSYIRNNDFDETIKLVKEAIDIPLIIFPGGSNQVSKFADAILYISLISGRNPNYLIGEQVKAAPLIKSMELEAIPTGYLLIESGKITAIEFISDTKPIPRDQAGIAIAHAMAAEMLGMKMIYLEAGSGAKYYVPESMIFAVSKNITVPLIVGGGIRTPDDAKSVAESGADFIVVGNILEESSEVQLISEMVSAISM